MSIKEKRAAELFSNGYNCAQAVLGPFCEEAEVGFDMVRIANGFGGGVRYGELCGAVSGAVMAIGLKCGFYLENDFEQKAFCNKKICEFMEKFKEANGVLTCRDLLGVDIRCPEDHSGPAAKEAHKAVCPKLVASAVSILESISFEK